MMVISLVLSPFLYWNSKMRSPTPEILDQLRAIAHQAEGAIENIG
jgi:hypothetical protein